MLSGATIVCDPLLSLTPDEPVTNPGFDDEPPAPAEPVRLFLLGGIDLHDSEGTELSAVLAQPKRLALLACLALTLASRFRRRDQLLGLFWPDVDEVRARGSLNRSLSFLRGWLGNDLIVSRGKDEVGVDRDLVWCDVTAFEAAIAAGDLAAAVDLYRGDLLEGFHVAGAPELTQWIERERARLRLRACTAAWALAARAEESGNMEEALFRARRAVELDLLDEPALRKLLGLLDRTGDRLGAARVYADFVRLLDREFEMEPSPETRALMETVRSRVRAHVQAEPTPAVSEALSHNAASEPLQTAPGQSATLEASAESRDANASGPATLSEALPRSWLTSWKRTPRVLAGLALLTGIALAAAQFLPRNGNARSAPINTVLVLPFTQSGDADTRFLEQGAAEILSANLPVPGELATIDARAVRAYLDANTIDVATPAALRAVGEHFHARYVVTGGVAALNNQLHIHASVVDARSGQRLTSASLRGTADQAFALFDDLTRQLLVALPGASQARLSRAAARSTLSLPALRAYLEGERHYRAGRFPAALDAYKAAIAHDSTFALANYRFDVAGDWTGTVTDDQSAEVVARALRHSARLPEPERLLIQAWAAYRGSDLPEADILYTRALRAQPNNLEAWYRLGELRFHWGTWFGRPYRLANDAFEHVRRYSPDDVPAIIHLARIATANGARAQLDSLIGELHRLDPDERILAQAQLLRAYGFGDAAIKRRAFAQTIAHGPQRIFDAAKLVAAHTTDLAGAAELANAFAEQGSPDQEHVVDAVAFQSLIELGRGRPEAARRLFARAPSPAAVDFRALALVQPWMSANQVEIEELRRQLAVMPGPESRWKIGDFLPRRIVLEGLLAVRAGDTIAARAFINKLREAQSIRPPYTETARYFSRVVEADVLRSRGKPAEALAVLGPVPPIEHITPTAFSYAFAYARFLRATLLEEAGQLDEALKWYATFPEAEGFEVVYRAPAHLAQGRIEQKLGRSDRAVAHFETAALLWRDAEPEVARLLQTRGMRP